jgi:hypothetical protein
MFDVRSSCAKSGNPAKKSALAKRRHPFDNTANRIKTAQAAFFMSA